MAADRTTNGAPSFRKADGSRLNWSRTRYGAANPEIVDAELWRSAVKHRWSAARLRQHLGVKLGDSHFRHQFSRHDYRETVPGPFWSWQRLGRTSTSLLDGRIVHVAGSHEDFYDPDFCIYNDVVVEQLDRSIEVFLYPRDLFPPTDFHSATLVGHEIILIGSQGYADLYRVGETQVLKLDTKTMRIEHSVTIGDGPGWISRHTARQSSRATIHVTGGMVQTPRGRQANSGTFALDLATMTWRPDAGDVSGAEALNQHVLESIEIELAVAGEQFPLDMDSLKLIDFFERNATGTWTCIRPIAIVGSKGEPVLIEPRQTFSCGMHLAGVDFYEKLQQLAWRSDRK